MNTAEKWREKEGECGADWPSPLPLARAPPPSALPVPSFAALRRPSNNGAVLATLYEADRATKQ